MISNGQLAQPNVNVDKAVEIGADQLIQFEALWPEGFYSSLAKQVTTFAAKKKRLTIDDNPVMDQEATYARVIGLLVSQRDLDLEQVLSTELTAYPPSMFQADGQMRVATGKSTLKKNLQVEAPKLCSLPPTTEAFEQNVRRAHHQVAHWYSCPEWGSANSRCSGTWMGS